MAEDSAEKLRGNGLATAQMRQVPAVRWRVRQRRVTASNLLKDGAAQPQKP